AQERHRPSTLLALFPRKKAAERRLDTEGSKEVAGHLNAKDRQRFGVTLEFVFNRVEEGLIGCHLLECLGVPLKLLECVDRVSDPGKAAFALIRSEPGKALRVLEWK